MELYHITKEKHLTSILTNGLKVDSGKTGFCDKSAHKVYKRHYGMQPIFLTNDIEFCSKTMLTNTWVTKNKAIVLRVKFELNETNSCLGPYDDGINPKEFRYLLNIESKVIEVMEFDLRTLNLEY